MFYNVWFEIMWAVFFINSLLLYLISNCYWNELWYTKGVWICRSNPPRNRIFCCAYQPQILSLLIEITIWQLDSHKTLLTGVQLQSNLHFGFWNNLRTLFEFRIITCGRAADYPCARSHCCSGWKRTLWGRMSVLIDSVITIWIGSTWGQRWTGPLKVFRNIQRDRHLDIEQILWRASS